MKITFLSLIFIFCIHLCGYSQSQFNNFENSFELEVLFEPGNNTLWQIGEPAKSNFNTALSLPNAIMTDSLNTYPINQTTWFEVEVNEFTLWSWPEIQLEWYYKADLEQGIDGGIIETSYDDGLTWKNVFSDPDFLPEMVGSFEIDTLFNGQVGITGVTSDWNWMAICWGNFIGELPINPSSIKVRYTFVSDSNDTQQDGWMMDNFTTQSEIIGSTTSQNAQLIKAFPNPTTDALYFDSDEFNQTDLKVHIYNNAGQLVEYQKLNTVVGGNPFIFTNHLDLGMYNVVIETEEVIFRTSFVKM